MVKAILDFEKLYTFLRWLYFCLNLILLFEDNLVNVRKRKSAAEGLPFGKKTNQRNDKTNGELTVTNCFYSSTQSEFQNGI